MGGDTVTLRSKWRWLEGITPSTFKKHRCMGILIGSGVAGTILASWFIMRSLLYNPDCTLNKMDPYRWMKLKPTSKIKFICPEKYVENKVNVIRVENIEKTMRDE